MKVKRWLTWISLAIVIVDIIASIIFGVSGWSIAAGLIGISFFAIGLGW